MNKRTVLLLTIVLLVTGSLLKLYYIHYTDTWERQHDVISFGAEEGHAYYIQYLADNKKLPDFDPREKWGLFQPPLHHIISATVLNVSGALGFKEKRAQENIQLFTCAYMILLSVLSVLIYIKNSKEWKTGALVTALIVAFHPVFILLSGSINNDALALILSLISLYTASVWYEKPSYINTLLLALLIGLSMFAKLTGGLVAVPIGILMVVKCFGLEGDGAAGVENKADSKAVKDGRLTYFFKNYLVKMCVFAVTVFPTGLYWSIRNKIKWNIPVNYIPPVGENYSENMTLLSRIFDIRTKSVYSYLATNENEYDEFNAFLLMLKSSLFGEYNYSEYGRLLNWAAKIIFVVAAVLIIVCLYATVRVITDKNSIVSFKWKILLCGTYITYLAAYLYFMFSHANFSAGDFRYAAICIIPEAIFLGLYTDRIKNKYIKTGILGLTYLFALSSLIVYVMLGLRE